MDQCTHEVRARIAEIILSMVKDQAGQSTKSWMDENGICNSKLLSLAATVPETSI